MRATTLVVTLVSVCHQVVLSLCMLCLFIQPAALLTSITGRFLSANKVPLYRLSAVYLQTATMTKLGGRQSASKIHDTLRKSVAVASKVPPGYFFRTGPGEYAEHDKFLGVTNPAVRLIAKEFKDLPLDDVQVLLESVYNEERFLGLVILTERFRRATPFDVKEEIFNFYIANVKHVNNWNLVDCSAHLILGPFLMDRNRDLLDTLARSKSLWERRIAMLATLHFIRNKDYVWTYKLAEMLLNDEHDLMHKAVGWMLREAGKKDLAPLLQFLDKHASSMPRTMLRYSLEKLNTSQREQYMAV